MKKLIIGLFSMAAFIFSAQAQETRKVKDRGEYHHQKEMTAKQLNLSATQKEQLKLNREAAKKQMQELDKNESLSVKEYKERKAAIYKEQKEKMDNILTDEQKSQLAKNRSGKNGKHEMKRTEKMEEMKSSLNLTDDQESRMKAYREARHSQAKAIKENEKLSVAEKKEQLKALKEQYKTEYKKILTPEQLQKMETMKKARKEKHQ